jgi:hypothetical protein
MEVDTRESFTSLHDRPSVPRGDPELPKERLE